MNFFTAVGVLDSGGVPQATNASGRAEDRLTLSEAELDSLGARNFQVRAEVAGFGGQVLEETFTIQVVSDVPVAAFNSRVRADNRTVDFTFTGNCACTLEYAWDFAGAGTSTEENPTFTFPTSGDKVVTLVVTSLQNPTLTGTATATITLPP